MNIKTAPKDGKQFWVRDSKDWYRACRSYSRKDLWYVDRGGYFTDEEFVMRFSWWLSALEFHRENPVRNLIRGIER